MAGSEEKVWFYMLLGHRRGPVSYAEMSRMLVDEEIFMESTQVWREGMEEWQDLVDCKEFKPAIKKVREAAEKVEAKVRHAASTEGVSEDLISRGASRALFNVFFYIGWCVPVLLGIVIVTELQVLQLIDPVTVYKNNIQLIVPLVLLVVALWRVVVNRMKNAGYDAWLGHLIFIPVANLYTLFICLFAPQNYQRTKEFDKAVWGYGALFLLMVGLPFTGLVPNVTPQSLNPVSLTEGLDDTYKFHTSYRARLKKSQDKAFSAEERRKAMEKESQSKGREGALRKRQESLN